MEEKLNSIVSRIEQSSLPDQEKDELYATISVALGETVWPVLAKYLPEEKLDNLLVTHGKVTIESYSDIIKDTLNDGLAIEEITKQMTALLTEIEALLQKEGI